MGTQKRAVSDTSMALATESVGDALQRLRSQSGETSELMAGGAGQGSGHPGTAQDQDLTPYVVRAIDERMAKKMSSWPRLAKVLSTASP